LKQVVLPLSPDYTGYGGVSLVPEALIAYKPTLDIDPAATFKYPRLGWQLQKTLVASSSLAL